MARIRSVKPEFFLDEEVAELSMAARLLFVGLWTLADRDGRLKDRPKRIKVQVLPYDDVEIDDLLDELASAEFIYRYTIGEDKYIQIRSFAKHQRPHPKESSNELPGPDHPEATASREITRQAVEENGRMRGRGNGFLSMDYGDGCSLEPGSKRPFPVPDEEAEPEPPVLTFPVVGSSDEWGLPQSKINEYAETYPGIDALAEARAARQWCIDNPPKRKTARGMPSFLNGWMERAQNRRGGASRGSSTRRSGDLSDLARVAKEKASRL